jgi:hypothetical protein
MKLAANGSFLLAIFAISAPEYVLSSEDNQETDQVDGWTVSRFPTEDALKEMTPFLSTSDDVPAHLQYVVGLDQSGLVGSWNRLPLADPEYGTALSGGKFTNEGKNLKQVINRCAGAGWTNAGKDFFTSINGDEDRCNLTFTWDEDRTKAVITGYFPEYLSAVDKVLSIEIYMRSYWKWKFGLKTKWSWSPFNSFNSLDKKCCPPKDGNKKCAGKGTLGEKGSTCETISMACGEVASEDVTKCALMRRQNLGAGFIPVFGYEVYALGDKHGEATPFFESYSKAVIDAGATTLFQGISEIEESSVESEEVPAHAEL